MWLTRLALRYPVSTYLIAATIAVLGFVSLAQLPIDLLPSISIPTVSVSTNYPGASPLDMEQTVTAPIERAVSSVNNAEYVQSSTREGSSRVQVYFNCGANTDVAMVDIIQRVNRATRNMPDGVSQPIVQRFDITSRPVCNIVVFGDMDQRDLYDLAANVIEPQIEHLPGVAQAPVSGGRIREIHVTLDRNRLQALKVPIQSVLTAIANSNLTLPSGDLKSGPFDYALKTESRFNLVQPMEKIVVKTVAGVPIPISAIGTVEDSYQEQTEIVRINGKPGLTLPVQKLANANTVAVVDRVRAALPHLAGVPPTVQVSISSDQSRYIRQTTSGLAREALLGALLAMLVIIVFIRSIRGTVIVALAIPLSILVAFIYFRFGNVTLNIMTFGGLALAVGRLVDDSIVALEVSSRHYGLRRAGQTKMDATLVAAQEVASPILVSTRATVIVFLPVVFLTGVAKLMFVPLTLTIAVALFGSYFVSRTVTPLMCYRWLEPERPIDRAATGLGERFRAAFHDAIERLDTWYEQSLRWTMARRRLVLLSITGLALLSAPLIKFIGTEFFPDQDESQFSVSFRLPVGTRVEETSVIAAQVEQLLQKNVPEIQTMITQVGGGGGRSSGSHAGSIQVTLVPADRRHRSVAQIANAVRPLLQRIPGATANVSAGGFLRFLLNFGSSAPIDIQVQGFDLATGSRLAAQVADIVRSTPGATDVQISREDNLPELRVKIDRDKAGVLGISAGDVASAVNACVSGAVASTFTDTVTGNAYDVLVRLDERFRSSPEDLQSIVLAAPGGQVVLLGNIATVTRTNSPVQIDRRNQQRLVDVTANVTGRDLGSVAADIGRKVSKLDLPPGFSITQSGNVEQQNATFRGLLLAFALAILLVYVVMASQFQSLVDPFIVMFTVPLGMVGVLWALFLTNTTLSVTSFQGIIVMVGVVVSNGVLLIDYTNRLRATGLPLREAVVTAGRTRLKPILMTTLTTVLGMFPMALGLGGESTQAPLAIAVIGGLSVSTALTLFFVPNVYTLFEERFKRKPATTPSA
ncbi:MAG: efflux RND transporter permease subunit [candidate division WOR-3 bacterium]|nr:efflux RND transporter permease subunit [candidate division WOR-3 bacterium]